MKKYIKHIAILTSSICIFSACNDDFLEKTPLDQISNETFWNTENDLVVYNNGLYARTLDNNNVPILFGHAQGTAAREQSIWFLDGPTDNFAPRGAGEYQQIRAGRHIVPTTPPLYSYKGWDFIRAINVGLENYGKAKVSDAIKNKYIAEARLFRGWFYADKVSKFGDVSYVDKSLNIDSPELFADRMPRNEVMKKVLEDLNFATKNLPNDWGDGNAPGRLNRWSALLIKSRICLYEGTWQKYRNGANANTWLTEASVAAKELMDKGPYSVSTVGDTTKNYNSYHRIFDLAGNKEVMYWRKFIFGIYTNNVMVYLHTSTGGATKSMVEDYLCTDGLPITLSPLYKGDAKIEDVFINRDPRLRQTILHPADVNLYSYDVARTYPRLEGMEGGNLTTTGYNIIKNYNNDDVVGKGFNARIAPAIILRFAEALLNYAEAQAELGVITQGDLDLSINKLRGRVKMPNMLLSKIPIDPRYTKDGVSPLIAEIRRERRVELFMEGFRYNDLMRWGQGKKLETISRGILWDAAAKARYLKANVKSSIDPANGKTYVDVYQGTDFAVPVFDPAKHYLWPIPLSVISQNTAIKQNPGW